MTIQSPGLFNTGGEILLKLMGGGGVGKSRICINHMAESVAARSVKRDGFPIKR